MRPERSRGVGRATRCARPRSMSRVLARRPVLGACALALAGTLYGASTEPLAWVLSSGVDAEAFLSLRFAFAAVALLLFCRRPVTDPVALLKAGVGCGLALASSYLCLVHGPPATGSTTAGVLVSGFGIWAAGIDALSCAAAGRVAAPWPRSSLPAAGCCCSPAAALGSARSSGPACSSPCTCSCSRPPLRPSRSSLQLTAVQSLVVALVYAGPRRVGRHGRDGCHWLAADRRALVSACRGVLICCRRSGSLRCRPRRLGCCS